MLLLARLCGAAVAEAITLGGVMLYIIYQEDKDGAAAIRA
jgi:hypothetical protein